jgi:hypothetical protein
LPPSKRSRKAGQYEKATRNGDGFLLGACNVDSAFGASRRRRWQRRRKFSWWFYWGRTWWIYRAGSEWSLIVPFAKPESFEPQHRSSI